SNLVHPAIPLPPYVGGITSAMDCVHATHDITLDPTTGVSSATLELRVKASGKALGAVGFLLDDGLEIGNITASDRRVTVAQSAAEPTRVVRVDLSPALEEGQETIVTMTYSGTLSCAGRASATTAAVCATGADFAYFAHQSVFPFIFDPDDPDNVTLDTLTRDIVVRVPEGNDVVVTGQKVSEVIDGQQKIARWSIDKPLSRFVGLYALSGKLGLLPVAGRSVPTTFVFPLPERSIDQELVSWSTPALDFVEKVSGTKLPFDRSLSLVRLPDRLRDPGTATFGMTLLSDSYARSGELLYEETWAHENAHLFWGIVVPEVDSNESRLMSEGMATLTQIDYTYARHFASEDRDLYLARRFLPMGLDIRTKGKDLPPAALRRGATIPEDFRTRRYTMWAYYRTALVLDHLRVTLGDEVFSSVLEAYRTRCSYVGCRPEALRDIASEISHKNMIPFFERWVMRSDRPSVRLSFTPAESGAEVELTKEDEAPMTLELWLGLADGTRSKQRVDLGLRTTRLRLEAPASVLSVAANPRHDSLVDVRSSVDGDLDFDGETDGFDVLRCARMVGRAYDATDSSGLWRVDESFDTRCDVNGDLTIDDQDIAKLSDQFGKLRPR
ncbi:MAG: Aminopeptidase, partial [Labilithrix sp.]|nr:Aminopeptidase [Labilithrix sp.]